MRDSTLSCFRSQVTNRPVYRWNRYQEEENQVEPSKGGVFLFMPRAYSPDKSKIYYYINGAGKKHRSWLNSLTNSRWWNGSAERINQEEEPAGQAVETVLGFKLNAAQPVFEWMQENFPGSIVHFLATDTIFIDPDGNEAHKLSRGDFDQEEEINRLEDLFTLKEQEAELTSTWVIAIGLVSWSLDEAGEAVSSTKRVVELEIEAKLNESLTKEEIKEYFNPNISPGFDALALAKKHNAALKIRNTSQEDFFPISQELAQLLIEKKIPTQAIFQALVSGEGEEIQYEEIQYNDEYEKYELISVSLLSLASGE